MLSSLLTMQRAMSELNNAQLSMVRNSDNMLKTAASFGNSQPLSPMAIAQADSFELQNKSNETKVTALQYMMDALEKSMGANIKRSTPHYGGLDYKA